MRKLSFDGIIYPDGRRPFLEYFKSHFDCVFLAFNPFFRASDNSVSEGKPPSFCGSRSVPRNEFKKDKMFGHIASNPNVHMYERNDDYPEDDAILMQSKIIRWEDVRSRGLLGSFSGIHVALLTGIGGLKKRFADERLRRRLDDYCQKETIWQPLAGEFSPFVRKEILRMFCVVGYDEIILQDEFGDERTRESIRYIEPDQFVNNVFLNGFRNCYSPDKGMLFTVGWDCFFFLICSSRANVETALEDSWLEGFYCRKETGNNWFIH